MTRELLEKYFNNTCSQKEKKEVMEWFKTMKGDFLEISAIEEDWKKFSIEEDGWDGEEVFGKIEKLIDQQEESKIQTKVLSLSQPKSKRYTWQLVAASIIFILAAGITFYLFKQKYADSGKETAQNVTIKENPKGRKTTFTLSDGTKVKLNAGSHLVFPEKFTDEERIVQLSGEAFFKVKRDEHRPFKIISGEVTTTVLGTSFNIRAFPDEKEVKVAVATGKVAVNLAKTSGNILLKPDEMLNYNNEDDSFVKGEFDRNEMFAWKDNIIYFNDASFEEIVNTLENWYGVTFIIKRKKPIDDNFKGKFKKESLREVLEGLSFSSDFEFEIVEDQVLIN